MRMRLATLTAIAAILATPALAADYLRGTTVPSLPPPPVIEQAPPVTWDGFYIGGLGGYNDLNVRGATGPNDLIARNLRDSEEQRAGASALLSIQNFSVRGSSFGAFAGYNFQFGEALLGVEADYMSINRRALGSDSITRIVAGSTVSLAGSTEARLIDMFTFRGRAGYVVGNFMPYVTGGLAVGRASVTDNARAIVVNAANGTNYDSGLLVSQRKQAAAAGFVIGAGLEAMLGGVFVRGEYLYSRLQAQNNVTLENNQYRLGAGVKF